MTAARRLEQHWRESGAADLSGPATMEDVNRFEQAYGLSLPLDFRNYVQCVDGFRQQDSYQDERGFNFWPLSKISRVDRFEEGKFHFLNDDAYFVFCDYLDFCWAYAISLGSSENRVVLVGTKDGQPKFVANSFTEFADLYLNDEPSIYV